MSGGKFALPALAAGLLAQMMMAQHAAGMAASAMRSEGEDEERRNSLEETRNRFRSELNDARRQAVEPNAIFPAHQIRLLASHDELVAAIESAGSEKEMWNAAQQIPLLVSDIKMARMNQTFHVNADTRQEQAGVKIRLDALRHALSQICSPEIAALDPAGYEAAQRAIAAAASAVEAGSTDGEALLQTAAEAIALHGRRGAERQAAKMAQTAAYERAATEIRAIVAGLRRDPMVAKWQAVALQMLESTASSQPASAEAPALLEQTRLRAAEIVKSASEAQFKADTRDYIMKSIGQSLAQMGFVVGEAVPEYPDHPASATVLQASTASGKSVLVSVPVEGEVWYEVDGYTKTTSAALSGDVTLACDEGERVLSEMHAKLDEEFHIEMSDIWWEGKDPNRNLRRADSLPELTGSGRDAGR